MGEKSSSVVRIWQKTQIISCCCQHPNYLLLLLQGYEWKPQNISKVLRDKGKYKLSPTMIRNRRRMIIGQAYKWDGKGVWEKKGTEMNAHMD